MTEEEKKQLKAYIYLKEIDIEAQKFEAEVISEDGHKMNEESNFNDQKIWCLKNNKSIYIIEATNPFIKLKPEVNITKF